MDTNGNTAKYYTPDIESFCIGFEYEFKDFIKDKWVHNILGERSAFTMDDFYEVFNTLSHTDTLEGYFRAKYLDKSDIEELGWEHVGGNKLLKSTTQEYHLDKIESNIVDGEKEYSGHQYRLYHNPSKNTVTIEKLEVDEFSGEPYYDLYEGNQNHIVAGIKVKNIGELKKLMKQLKIGE